MTIGSPPAVAAPRGPRDPRCCHRRRLRRSRPTRRPAARSRRPSRRRAPSPSTPAAPPRRPRRRPPGRSTARARSPGAGRRRPRPTRSTSPFARATRRRMLVAEQVGRVRVVRDGAVLRRPVPRHRRRRSRPAASRACSVCAVHPDPADGRVFVYYTADRRPPGRGLVPARPGRPGPAVPDSEVCPAAHGRPVRQPQRRRAGVRAGRLPVHRRPATAAAAATRSTRGRRPRHRCWPRSCASTSTRGRRRPALRHPGRQPVRRRRRRRAARDLADRACATRGASASTATTGDLWIGDVGQGACEEIDVAPAGRRRPRLRLEHHGGHALLPRPTRATRPGLTCRSPSTATTRAAR